MHRESRLSACWFLVLTHTDKVSTKDVDQCGEWHILSLTKMLSLLSDGLMVTSCCLIVFIQTLEEKKSVENAELCMCHFLLVEDQHISKQFIHFLF